MKNLKIKKINKNDLNTFVKLWNQDYLLLTNSGFRLSFQKAYTGFKNKMFDYYGLYLNNNLIGFILIKKDNPDNFFWLKHMLIDKNYRSLGFGKYFLSWVIKKYKRIKTEFLKKDKKAISFFPENGFKVKKEDEKKLILAVS